jgi:hypothetical protein
LQPTAQTTKAQKLSQPTYFQKKNWAQKEINSMSKKIKPLL